MGVYIRAHIAQRSIYIVNMNKKRPDNTKEKVKVIPKQSPNKAAPRTRQYLNPIKSLKKSEPYARHQRLRRSKGSNTNIQANRIPSLMHKIPAQKKTTQPWLEQAG